MALDRPTANPITPGKPKGIPGQHQAYCASQGGWAVAWASQVGHCRAVNGMPCRDSVAARATIADGGSGSDLEPWAGRVQADHVAAQHVAYPSALGYAPNTRLAAQYAAAQTAMAAHLHRAETVVQRILANLAPSCTGVATRAGVWLGANGLGWYNRVGDCHIYHLRPHSGYLQLTALTECQTFRNTCTAPPMGIPPDEPCHMGTLDVCSIQLRPGDVLLLCTDGLHGMVNDFELANHLTRCSQRAYNLLPLFKGLLRLARLRGSTDDIAVLLVQRLV